MNPGTANLVLCCGYAKESKKNAKCKRCRKNIEANHLRLGKVVKAKNFDGEITNWFHEKCIPEYIKQSKTPIETIRGFFVLKPDDKTKIEARFGKSAEYSVECGAAFSDRWSSSSDNGEPPVKKTKRVDQKALLDDQNEKLSKLKDSLRSLKPKEVKEILIHNDQYIKKRGTKALIDLLADIMRFGALEKCKECGYGQLEFDEAHYRYRCRGWIRMDDGWIKCHRLVPLPSRKQFTISNKYKGQISSLLNEYKSDEYFYPVYTGNTSNEKRVRHVSKLNKTPKTEKAIIFDTSTVDRKSGLANVAEVFEDDNIRYSEVFVRVLPGNDNRNSWYKIQVLKSKRNETFWVFSYWGRTGTEREGTSQVPKKFDSKEEAIEYFKTAFKKITGNKWESRYNFEPQPGKYQLYRADFPTFTSKVSEKKLLNKLDMDEKVVKLISLIYGIENFNNALKEFHIDVHMLPLGILHDTEIQNAYRILSEIEKVVDQSNLGELDRNCLLAKSKRFYEIIPHDFGDDEPPVISSSKEIEEKMDLLECLSRITETFRSRTEEYVESLETHEKYKELNTTIEVLPQDAKEFSLILESVTKTQGQHHKLKLTVMEIFKVNRSGEAKKFEKFANINNKRLLWHGSQTTNFVGILKNGLKKAPPSAPRTGSMFGKGIYFADVVTKSAQYCKVENGQGLMLLCEVALGKMYEQDKAHFFKSPPEGYDSVKGIGKYPLGPKHEFLEGAKISVDIPADFQQERATSLTYDEYIVYDRAQVKIKYLVKMQIEQAC